jgi:hypothetical protein
VAQLVAVHPRGIVTPGTQLVQVLGCLFEGQSTSKTLGAQERHRAVGMDGAGDLTGRFIALDGLLP